MKPQTMLKVTATGVFLALAVGAGGPVGLSSIAIAGDRSPEAKTAADAARKAEVAIRKKEFALAVEQAELAVSFEPKRADYRLILAQAYMRGGRFQSAETTYQDVLDLDSSNGRAALNLALMQIAAGRNQDALTTLDTHREKLSAADFGLAVALAGDPESAVRILEAAVRVEGSDAKARQNLALAFALSGRWVHARIMAARDVPYDRLNERMAEWAQFSRPTQPSDQVASLMGVVPTSDAGQPQRLALNMPSGRSLALTLPEPEPETPVADATEAAPSDAARFEVSSVAAPVISIPLEPSEPAAAKTSDAAAFATPAAPATRASVVPLIRASYEPLKQVVVPASTRSNPTARPVESGKYVVQLGAFSSASRAELAWERASAKIGALGGHSASTAQITINGATLHRLSVSGFGNRQAAVQVCSRVQAAGGSCFVRSVAGDTPMQWANRGGTKLASRR
jgi:Flp pilus assembly protein TadD/cell division protein FtsN